MKYTKTGSDLLDCVIGGGLGYGIPLGKIINLVGDKSAGKTFLACEIYANAYHAKGNKFYYAYKDAESGFTHDTKALYGVKMKDETERKVETVQELQSDIFSFCKKVKQYKKEGGVYILDSLDGLSSTELKERTEKRYRKWQKDKDFDEGSYLLSKQKFLSGEFFPEIAPALEDANVLLVIISQVRTKINAGMFEKKQIRAGGKALDFYSHTVIWFANKTKIVAEINKGGRKYKRPIGYIVSARSDKSKTPRPYRSCEMVIYYDFGLDNISSNLDFLYGCRGEKGKLLKEKSGKLDFDGKVFEYNELIDYIEKNGLERELRKKVYKRWEEIEESARPKRKRRWEKKDVKNKN